MRLRTWVLVLAVCAALGSFTHAQDFSDSHRKMVNRVVPAYPSLAQKMGISGSVKIEAVVGPNGTVKATGILGGLDGAVWADDGFDLHAAGDPHFLGKTGVRRDDAVDHLAMGIGKILGVCEGSKSSADCQHQNPRPKTHQVPPCRSSILGGLAFP